MALTRWFSCLHFVFDLFCYFVHALFRKESLRNQGLPHLGDQINVTFAKNCGTVTRDREGNLANS